jgi:hypothetical protein
VIDFATLPDVNDIAQNLEQSPVTVGVGLHYKIAVPSLGLPLVPVVN